MSLMCAEQAEKIHYKMQIQCAQLLEIFEEGV